MKNKNIRRIIMQIVIIATLVIMAIVIRTEIEKKYTKDSFDGVNISINKKMKEKKEGETPMITEGDMVSFSKEDVLAKIKGVIPEDKNPSIEELNLFGNEFRIKAKEITDKEKDEIKGKLEEGYKDKELIVNVQSVQKYPKIVKNRDIKLYIIYISVIVVLTAGSLYLINLSEKKRGN